ncbi:MAG: cyclomaltodextrinase C-terminal domain-containing protein, partial [Schleiferiaceae bacterium]
MGSFAYAWYSDSEVILVLANGDDRAHRWPTERVAELGITPETPFTDLLQGGTSPAGTELTFPAKGIRILRAAR